LDSVISRDCGCVEKALACRVDEDINNEREGLFGREEAGTHCVAVLGTSVDLCAGILNRNNTKSIQIHNHKPNAEYSRKIKELHKMYFIDFSLLFSDIKKGEQGIRTANLRVHFFQWEVEVNFLYFVIY
jgi:hypothetical protein